MASAMFKPLLVGAMVDNNQVGDLVHLPQQAKSLEELELEVGLEWEINVNNWT